MGLRCGLGVELAECGSWWERRLRLTPRFVAWTTGWVVVPHPTPWNGHTHSWNMVSTPVRHLWVPEGSLLPECGQSEPQRNQVLRITCWHLHGEWCSVWAVLGLTESHTHLGEVHFGYHLQWQQTGSKNYSWRDETAFWRIIAMLGKLYRKIPTKALSVPT